MNEISSRFLGHFLHSIFYLGIIKLWGFLRKNQKKKKTPRRKIGFDYYGFYVIMSFGLEEIRIDSVDRKSVV